MVFIFAADKTREKAFIFIFLSPVPSVTSSVTLETQQNADTVFQF